MQLLTLASNADSALEALLHVVVSSVIDISQFSTVSIQGINVGTMSECSHVYRFWSNRARGRRLGVVTWLKQIGTQDKEKANRL